MIDRRWILGPVLAIAVSFGGTSALYADGGEHGTPTVQTTPKAKKAQTHEKAALCKRLNGISRTAQASLDSLSATRQKVNKDIASVKAAIQANDRWVTETRGNITANERELNTIHKNLQRGYEFEGGVKTPYSASLALADRRKVENNIKSFKRTLGKAINEGARLAAKLDKLKAEKARLDQKIRDKIREKNNADRDLRNNRC